MSIFVDTSALFAVLDADDQNHMRAGQTWAALLTGEEQLICSNYVLVELFALAQRRLGLEAVRVLQEDVTPVLEIIWVDEDIHRTAINALLTAARRELSLVDCVSFEAMRRLGLKRAFTFDHDFAEAGFECIP